MQNALYESNDFFEIIMLCHAIASALQIVQAFPAIIDDEKQKPAIAGLFVKIAC